MKYIVYDTEFNQPQPKLYNANAKFTPNRICPFEIIEIGAVKINENMEIEDTFKRYIKPVIYRTLSPIVVKKTKITRRVLESGFSFKHVMMDFRDWIGSDYLLCTWSDNDIRIMKSNCRYHGLSFAWLDKYYDIQKHCSEILNLPRGERIGLKRALTEFGIEQDGKLHQALEDAIYSAKVFIKVYERNGNKIWRH